MFVRLFYPYAREDKSNNQTILDIFMTLSYIYSNSCYFSRHLTSDDINHYFNVYSYILRYYLYRSLASLLICSYAF